MRYLTASEAAKELNLSVPTIKRYIYQGRLKSVKLPGGQHRIPEAEILRVLPDGTESPPQEAPSGSGVGVEERLEVIERWMTDLEADIERLAAALEVVSTYCAGAATVREEEAPAVGVPERAHRVRVLGPGCRRCDGLYTVVTKVLEEADWGNVRVERVKDLEDIASYGPVLTPALVVDDRLVFSGKVPREREVQKLLAKHLA